MVLFSVFHGWEGKGGGGGGGGGCICIIMETGPIIAR